MDTNKSQQISKHKYSAGLRLWHWLNALVITALLITVLINSTLNSRKSAVAIYQQNKENMHIEAELIKSVIHQQEDRVWEVHIYLGYALVSLFIFRLILEFFQNPNLTFKGIVKNLFRRYKNRETGYKKAKSKLIIRVVYAVFYLLVWIMINTGLGMIFRDDLGISRTTSHTMKEIHGFSMYLIIFFILAHIVGVILAERSDEKGITSDMIHGGENKSI